MKNKELKIQVPEGYEIDRENSTFEKIVFKKVENELPKRWKDLHQVKGWAVGEDNKIYSVERYTWEEYRRKNIFPTKEEAEACVALAQLCQLRDRYNNGWRPDWDDGGEQKYAIKIENNKTVKYILTSTSSVLSFKSVNLRDEFLENFRDLIEIAKPLL